MWTRRGFLGGSLAAGVGYIALPTSKSASAGTLPAEAWAGKLIAAARSQIGVTLVYDPAYSRIAYPDGDVDRAKGVCTDVIVRAYRDGLGLDLQRLVHEDMRQAFSAYPVTWGLTRPDSNIDHRRVPNLETFLERRKAGRPIGTSGLDYQPGDIVTQRLPGNRPHILLASDELSADGARPLMIHNIGGGTQIEDMLFAYRVTGHYRYPG
jgi:uncharacterized protein YijF (DUF1287 family)